MTNQRSRTEITSADKQQLGIDYQYLYFIIRLLHLLPGEEVGYECLDDVHIITNNNETEYIQIKHTIEKDSNEAQTNLTKMSGDLWKTLSNWSKLICDSTEGRSGKDTQKYFLSNSRFIFVVNRKIENNEVINKIQQLNNHEIKISEFKSYLAGLKQETTDTIIKGYIDDVSKLSAHVLSAFCKKIEFRNSKDSLFDDIRNGIKSKMVDDEYVDDVLGAIYLQLKENFFATVQDGGHQVITYSEWTTRYRAAFNRHRTTLLPLHHYSPILPDHLEQQYFVKELVEIGAINLETGDMTEIAELTEHYLSVELQLDGWNKEGRITTIEINDFHKEAALTWKRIHQACHRSTSQDISMDYTHALKCFDDVMREKLSLLSSDIGLPLSNGEFIKLANDNHIGWKYSWVNRRIQHEN